MARTQAPRRQKLLELSLDKAAAADLDDMTPPDAALDDMDVAASIATWQEAREHDPFWEDLVPQRIVVSDEEYEWLERELSKEPLHDSSCDEPEALPCGCLDTCEYDDYEDVSEYMYSDEDSFYGTWPEDMFDEESIVNDYLS